MRIIVNGAAGLIGSAIAERLRGQYEVIGVDVRAAPTVGLAADCLDVADWGPAVGSVDAIVHVAALHAPHVGRRSDEDFRATNVDGTAWLLDFAVSTGVRHFVLTSTTSLYGHALEPARRAVWVDEELEPRPRDIYDATKLAAERLVEAAASANFACTSLRMSRCFPEPAALMAAYRLHRGIDRRDVAEAHALALRRDGEPYACYVISAASPFERGDCGELVDDAPAVIERRCPGLAARMAECGWAVPRSIGRVYDAGRAEGELGFRARFGIHACLAGDWDPPPSG